MKLSKLDRAALRECLAAIEHAHKSITQADGTARHGGDLLPPLNRLTPEDQAHVNASLALPAQLLGRFLAYH